MTTFHPDNWPDELKRMHMPEKMTKGINEFSTDLPDDYPDSEEVKTENYGNTVTTNAGSFNTWGDPNIPSENVNKIEPEDVHLDRIGNKTDVKTPIKIKTDDYKQYSLKANLYRELMIILDDYERLLYKEIARLSNLHYSPGGIQCYLDHLTQLNKFIDAIHDSSEPKGRVVLDDIDEDTED